MILLMWFDFCLQVSHDGLSFLILPVGSCIRCLLSQVVLELGSRRTPKLGVYV